METLERLIGTLRQCCGSFPDKRKEANTHYAMADFGLAAFSLFFMQRECSLECVWGACG